MSAKILLVEDDVTFRSFMKAVLDKDSHEIVEASNAYDALALLKKRSFDLLISDLKMPGMSGLELYGLIKNDPAHPAFIVLTAYGTIEEAVSATRAGVYDFLTKPLKDPQSLRDVVDRALKDRIKERHYAGLKENEAAGLPPEEIIFCGEAMQKIKRLIKDVAATQSTVLIHGESGTGKELAARSVHIMSPRSSAAFITVNCASIPENLLESELFGHEKGAFTGAIQSRRGKFELAHGGTIFLDEIGEMPLPLQSKLLRVIQERKFERVGGNREISVDVRIVAATNRILIDEVREKRFREDLYYRINVFPIHLPPLRERRETIPVLARYFIKKNSCQTGKKVTGIGEETEKLLIRYSWPGNVRELQNAVERAVIIGQGLLTEVDFPGIMETNQSFSAVEVKEQMLAESERHTIMAALDKCGGNRTKASELLGISRRTLQYRISEYGLSRKK